MNLAQLPNLLADPPRAFDGVPFWFWNDELEEAELIRQLRTFYAKSTRPDLKARG